MEQKDIRYTGITQSSSDLDCPDGNLSLSHNIINENDVMRPIVYPDAEFSMGTGEKLLYIHTTANYKNYIYLITSSIKAFKIVGGNRVYYAISHVLESGEEILSIQSFGNVIILMTSLSLQYIILKNGEYIYLGDKIPDLNLSFTLSGASYSVFTEGDKDINIDQNDYQNSTFYSVINQGGSTQLSDQILSAVNSFMADKKSYGQFMEPFFVRYAYNTINGYTMHSVPVLLVPNAGNFPFVKVTSFDLTGTSPNEKITGANGVNVKMNVCLLLYKIISSSIISDLKKWEDIVLSVDIFVSSPISRCKYDGDEWRAFRGTINGVTLDSYNGVGAGLYGFYSFGGLNQIGIDSLGNDIYGMSADFSDYTKPQLSAPQIDYEEYQNKIKSNSLFYKVASIPLDKIDDYVHNSYYQVNINDGVLSILETQEKLDNDDYNTHDKIIASHSFVYNSRLNIANIKRIPYGFTAKAILPYTNGYLTGGNAVFSSFNYKIYVFVKDSGGIVKIESEISSLYHIGPYLFYPNPNAYRMIIEREGEYMDVSLKEHPYLNGSYYFKEFDSSLANYFEVENIPVITSKPSIIDSNNVNYVIEQNKIYTSEVNNPFYFPLSGINTVGLGSILGISSTTKALSQGQFGQFPLIVFSTDGIWAMEVSSDGLYSTKQPISRDVVSNSNSITQIDGAVVFITDKGVMVVDGSTVSSLSSVLDGPSFDISSVIKLQDILTDESIFGEIGNIGSIKEFFSECKIAYDYSNARLIFFRNDTIYCYVYSIHTGSWATASSTFEEIIADYPSSYLQKANGEVVNISTKVDYDSGKTAKCFLLSRPIKLGDDAYKSINMIINRGHINRNSGAIVLFASSDGFTYFPIDSVNGQHLSRLQGSPYKYFRVLTLDTLSINKSISATSIYFTPKWRNKPR